MPGSGDPPFLTYAEISFARSEMPPASGWHKTALPAIYMLPEARAAGLDPPSVWLRTSLLLKSDSPGAQAVFLDRQREGYTVWVNGVPIFTTASVRDEASLDWMQPRAVIIPDTLLHRGVNQIAIRIVTVTPRPLAAMDIAVGAARPLVALAANRATANSTGPRMAASALLVLSIALILLWLGRRRETAFLWLAVTGLIWVLHLVLHVIAVPSVWPGAFYQLDLDLLFAIMVTGYGFVFAFLDLPGRERQIVWLMAFATALVALRHWLLLAGLTDLPAFLLMLPCTGWFAFAAAQHCITRPDLETVVPFAGALAATALSFHDLGLITGLWAGVGVQVMPYGGLILFATFLFALGRRLLRALASEEAMNEQLAAKVVEIRAELARSEENLRQQMVAQALTGERMRLMREIHDGVGSRITSAIAVARTDPAAEVAVRTLRLAMTDLRIAVDSLEPVAGDVATLVASFRHRIEPDLRDIGVRLDWRVEAVPTLDWLTPEAALNILRILQEAVANVLAHAGAQNILCAVSVEDQDLQPGIAVRIGDDGCGFDASAARRGHGITNMRARAGAIGGTLDLQRDIRWPTIVVLWLPLRQPPSRAAFPATGLCPARSAHALPRASSGPHRG